MNSIIKIIKVFLYSLPFFLSTEIILGKWLLPQPKVSILPSSLYSEKIKFKFSKEWRKYKTKEIATYTRDELGYRGWESKSYKDSDLYKLILVIGDSTTDQRFEDDSSTWTEIMENYLHDKGLNYIDVVNGGIDGHTTYGYLQSIENWHTNDLNFIKPNLSTIIFNIGINEVKYFIRNKSGELKDINKSHSSKSAILKNYIVKNSFFYTYLKSLLKGEEIIYKDGAELIIIDKSRLRNWDFKEFYEKKTYNYSLDPTQAENYKIHFQKLILKTMDLFPYSKIIISQPYIPACDFSSKSHIIQRMPSSEKKQYSESFCKIIKEVFHNQEVIVNDLKKNNQQKIYLYKMYENVEINDIGFYDFIHPVGIGNEILGNTFGDYLYKFISNTN